MVSPCSKTSPIAARSAPTRLISNSRRASSLPIPEDQLFREEIGEAGHRSTSRAFGVGHWFMREERRCASMNRIDGEDQQSKPLPLIGLPVHKQSWLSKAQGYSGRTSRSPPLSSAISRNISGAPDAEAAIFCCGGGIWPPSIPTTTGHRPAASGCLTTIVPKDIFIAYQFGALLPGYFQPRFETALILLPYRSTNALPIALEAGASLPHGRA